MLNTSRIAGAILIVLGSLGCKSDPDERSGVGDGGAGGAPAVVMVTEGECLLDATAEAPDSARELPCKADFDLLASDPVDASLPGATSAKVVFDTADNGALYFQNSKKYKIHYEFVKANLSGGALPQVADVSVFESTEYYRPDRRFVLGAVSYYESAKVWALEFSPYDTASTDMIQALYEAVAAHAYFGPVLKYHPTSEAQEALAKKLPASVQVKTTKDLYGDIDYQPLTLATTMGRLHFAKAADLDEEYVSYTDIVVLDEAPNDISVVAGLITEQFQTPLSHVNVLSQNRKTPNMGLRDAFNNEKLLALKDKWVKLTVASDDWDIEEVSADEALAFLEEKKPEPVQLPALNLDEKRLLDIEDVTPEPADKTLREAIKEAVNAWGGKAAQYSILAKTDDVPMAKAFGIPVFYYNQFMTENGLFDRIDALLSDKEFLSDPAVREAELTTLRADMMTAPVDADFQALLKEKISKEYPGYVMRFRTSTNSEDLEGFPCAGCYESASGDPKTWDTVLDAVRGAWASIWLFRTFEERSYYGVDHHSVGMALLVHHNFPNEEANGVAVTNNVFNTTGLEPAFYVNVQKGGDAEVVHPPPGVTSDTFLYYFDNPNQPIRFISHSNLVPDGETVLTTAQTHELGVALKAIHERFSPAYGPKSGNTGWYGMDCEFKFDDMDRADGKPHLFIKQARPYPKKNQ